VPNQASLDLLKTNLRGQLIQPGDDRIRATYRGNYDRLVAIKSQYDPANFFRVHQNIKPSAPAP
jgi:hypothetical protein